MKILTAKCSGHAARAFNFCSTAKFSLQIFEIYQNAIILGYTVALSFKFRPCSHVHLNYILKIIVHVTQHYISTNVATYISGATSVDPHWL